MLTSGRADSGSERNVFPAGGVEALERCGTFTWGTPATVEMESERVNLTHAHVDHYARRLRERCDRLISAAHP